MGRYCPDIAIGPGAGQIGDVDVGRYCPYIAIAWRSGGGEEVAEEVAGVAGLDGGDVFGWAFGDDRAAAGAAAGTSNIRTG